MQQDIAIIGMAGRFPGARNIHELHRNLAAGVDSVGPISPERIRRTALDPQRECMVAGYLDHIDCFDHSFFNIVAGEARTMDPHLRLLLEVAWETFDNAAFTVDTLKRHHTAVIVADAALEYYRHAEALEPTLATGNTKAFLATMLARQFDLRGNAFVADTTCSSSLLAVHLACNELLLGDADLALAAAANLYLFPYREGSALGLDAPDGRSKAFSAKANGMSHGEAVACVLLKPLQRALADGDIIHAVIKGSAVNCNARRSASLTAPDSTAQAEVIVKAWKKAGIDPRNIGFVEAHGSGTELGDNIEVGGFSMAFDQFTADRAFCPISTIKSNIGHTRAAAGIAGLIKTILSLKNQTIYPTIHVDQPHPHIPFHKSAVYVNRSLQTWEPCAGGRLAAVSSIGLSGTNCHMVLAEAPAPVPSESNAEHTWPYYLFPLSAKTPQALLRNIGALRHHLAAIHGPVADISYTLCAGRNHFPYRTAVMAATRAGLQEQLDQLLTAGVQETKPGSPVEKLVFVLDHAEDPVDEQLLNYFIHTSAFFRKHFSAAEKYFSEPTPAIRTLLFQYCFYKLLGQQGIVPAKTLASGWGRIAADLVREKISWEQAAEKLSTYRHEPAADLAQKAANVLEQETADGPVIFVGMGGRGALSDVLIKITEKNTRSEFLTLDKFEPGCPFLRLVQSLYLLHYNPNWQHCCLQPGGRKTELPAYSFESTRCWLRDKPADTPFMQLGQNAPASEPTGRKRLATASGMLAELAVIWEAVLLTHDVAEDDDFFALGGDSIGATKLVNRINAAYGTRLSFEDVFDFPTLRQLAAYIDQQCTTEQKLHRIWTQVLQQEELSYDDDFFELGGHSLIANQVINRIRKKLGVAIHFDDFFHHPTIRSMSRLLEERLARSRTHDSAIPPLPPQPYYDVSHAQKRIWILSQSQAGAMAYNQPGLYEINSPIDVDALKRAFEALIARHEILRTTFALEEGEPVQKVQEPGHPVFLPEYLDYRQRPQGREAALEFAAMRATTPFDLEKGPLIRALLIQTGESAYIFLLDLHHIITDGWSNGILIRDLMLLYHAFRTGSPNPLMPLRIQYKDYAAWQNALIRTGAFDAHRDFWLSQFREPVVPLAFPTDYERPAVKTFNGKISVFAAGEELTARMKALCRQCDATLFMLLLSALNVLLYRFSGQRDITIGTPAANRDHADIEDQIGFYVNTLAMRTQFDPDERFEQLLQRVKENTLNAYAHSTYPFDLLVEHLNLVRDPARSPLFDVMLTLQNLENDLRYRNAGIGELQVTSHEPDIYVSKFDLTFSVSESDHILEFVTEYSTDLFTEKTIHKIQEGFILLLQLVCTDPKATIAALRNQLYHHAEQDMMAFYKAFAETNLDEV